MAVVEGFKQESMHGLPAKESVRCSQAFSQDFESGSPNFMWAKGPHSINNHQRAYLFIADGKVAWGRLGKSISLNSGFACEIASLNFDSFDQNRKETR